VILAPFRVRSFRFQWPADLLTSLAFEMETVVLSWYVMVETGSVLLLTTFGALLFLGTLAAPMFGVLSDRLGARNLLAGMRGAYALLAATLTLLAFSGRLSPLWVFVVAVPGGIVRPNDQVLRNILVGETMPPAQLMGALGLSRATMDSARVVGSLAGAGIFAALGFGAAYVLVVALYAGSLLLTLGMSQGRPVAVPVGDQPASADAAVGVSGLRDLVEGLLHIWRSPALVSALWLAFLINLTAYPISGGLLAYIAREIYHTDATGLGRLAASFSLGALVGSVAFVLTGGPRRPERAMLVHAALWYAVLLVFGFVGTLGGGIVALFLAGIVQSVAMISLAAWLLIVVDDRFRGRVMGVRMLAVYGLPLGLLAAGALIDLIGYTRTVTALTVIGLVFTGLIGLRWRASLWGPRRGAASAQRL
jgi:predicted MFS family arabinose efflux permease